MNIKIKALISGFIFSVIFSFIRFSGNCDNISNKIFRLHIIANSDSAEDQALKLKVRDRILNEFGSNFLDANDIISAENIAEKNLDKIQNISKDEINKNGFSYPVSVKIVHMYFNTRYYGNVTMPAGYYDALRITIGEAKGKNWWCVMFPPMCVPAAEGSTELEKILNDFEIDITTSQDKYVIEFKMVDIYLKVRELINEFILTPTSEFFSSCDAPYDIDFAFLKSFSI